MGHNPLDKIKNISTAYMESSVLLAAADLDIFTRIIKNGNSISLEKIVKLIKANLRATEVLLNTLVAMGFLTLTKNQEGEINYSVLSDYSKYLDSSHEDSFIPMLRHMGVCQRSWSRLAWSVLSGKAQNRQNSILGKEEDNLSYIRAMNSAGIWLAEPLIKEMEKAGFLEFKTKTPAILDIGGASGTYTKAFLDILPHAVGAIFDLPIAISEAKKRFEGTGYASRVRYFEGNFFQNSLPKEYDLAWLSAIIHSYSRDESVELYKNAYQSLKPGGKLAIRDHIMENETSSLEGNLFGVNMLVQTSTGRVYTIDEVKEDLEEAGFVNCEMAIKREDMCAVAIGYKEE